MIEGEVQHGLRPKSSLCGQQACGQGGGELRLSESVEALMFLADVALAPPGGEAGACSCDGDGCRCAEVREMEKSLQSLQLQLILLMSRADDLLRSVDKERDLVELGAVAATVPSFLFSCRPYFNYLQSTVWNRVSQNTSLPLDVYARLLDLSRQLCDKLEQLVLTYARHGLLCLDETEPSSLSHFCMGQSQIGRLRVTVFRYCRPTPYLARANTGLFKRMRWNVERLREKQQQQQQQQRADEGQNGGREECEADTAGDTEYYFLCCEDIPSAPTRADDLDACPNNITRMWTIGQWVQVNPNPNTEDVYEWITCEVPQANYHRLLFLGSEEPSSCSATDLLQELLVSNQTLQ